MSTSASQIDSQAVSSAVSALVQGRGVTGSTNTSAGTYTVTFGASVTSCVYQATINGAGGAFGFVSTAAGSSGDHRHGDHTFDPAGTLTNMPFYLRVNC